MVYFPFLQRFASAMVELAGDPGMAVALAEGMADTTLWRTPDPVWTPGRGLGRTAGSALDWRP